MSHYKGNLLHICLINLLHKTKSTYKALLNEITIVMILFLRYGDHYEWNKAVTCIHNVFSQQRYLEHYGEVTIQNLKSSVCICKITFVKVNETVNHNVNSV